MGKGGGAHDPSARFAGTSSDGPSLLLDKRLAGANDRMTVI